MEAAAVHHRTAMVRGQKQALQPAPSWKMVLCPQGRSPGAPQSLQVLYTWQYRETGSADRASSSLIFLFFPFGFARVRSSNPLAIKTSFVWVSQRGAQHTHAESHVVRSWLVCVATLICDPRGVTDFRDDLRIPMEFSRILCLLPVSTLAWSCVWVAHCGS
jgi:hypothetical protein